MRFQWAWRCVLIIPALQFSQILPKERGRGGRKREWKTERRKDFLRRQECGSLIVHLACVRPWIQPSARKKNKCRRLRFPDGNTPCWLCGWYSLSLTCSTSGVVQWLLQNPPASSHLWVCSLPHLCMGSREQTGLSGLHGKLLYLLSHLSAPALRI